MHKKTTSSKLKSIICAGCVLTLIMISSIIILFIYSNTYLYTLYHILTCAMMLCLLSGPLLVFLYYRELKKITNASAEYYARKLPHVFTDSLLSGFCFYPGLMLFIGEINVSFSILVSIHLTLFALIFTLYCFVLPLHKKQISKNYNSLNKFAKNVKDKIELAKIQGKIYKNSLKLDNLTISIFISTFTFLLGIINYIFFGQYPITYITVLASILFNIIYLFRLIIITQNIYAFDLEKLQRLFENQNKIFNKKKLNASKIENKAK